ncbi:MAG: DUF2283 domain-containing protein [Bacteroidetes bacterium]|nr:DUF2283 domain-containing protein [Bacteroidota bacterium]
MTIHYDSNTDLLYLRLDTTKQTVINKQVSEDITLDMGIDDKIVGIEILDASKKVALADLLPLHYELKKAS